MSAGIVIRYKSHVSAFGTALLYFGLACWLFSIVTFVYSCNFIGSKDGAHDFIGQQLLAGALTVLGLPASEATQVTMFMVAFYMALGTGIVFAVHVFREKIGVNADLISFPISFHASLFGRRERLWSDISQVSFLQKDHFGIVRLFFKSGGSASINLNCIEVADIEKLLLFIETRASSATKSIEFELLLDQVHNEKIHKGELSFTEIWEEDINRNFGATAYMPIEPGTVLQNGTISVVRQLSAGGFSAVYIAKCGDERVILKEAAVPNSIATEEKARAEALLEKESSLLLQLEHPQIVKVRDFFRENNRSYLVVDFVSGENLRQFVRRQGPQDEATVRDWCRQIARILVYLHNHDPSVIHRDITPDNLILGDDGQLTLIDFGAANEYLSTATGTVIGKQSYISPEQFRGKAQPASDIYGLGATMYFLLTGKDPEALSCSRPQEAKTEISKEMNQMVAKCTDLKSENRPTAEDLQNIFSADSGHVIVCKTKQNQ